MAKITEILINSTLCTYSVTGIQIFYKVFLVVESVIQNLGFKVTFSVRRTSDRVGLNRSAVLVVMLGKSLKRHLSLNQGIKLVPGKCGEAMNI